MSSQHQEESVKAGEPNSHRNIYSCNFRSAGRLSNENARSLTAIHEILARQLASALDAYLGTSVDVKLTAVDQLPVKEHMTELPPLTHIIPYSFATVPSTMIVECDINLVFPIVELLLGGTGQPVGDAREMSEIEEEIMHDVITLVVQQAQMAWRIPSESLVASRRIRSSVLQQHCPPNEKVTLARMEVDISGTTGFLNLVFPAAFLSVLIQQIKQDQPRKRGAMRFFARANIRERILDCDVQVAAELQNLPLSVRDLVGLQPGSVLKLRAPIRTPGSLTAGGYGMFEAIPVRNGSQKAAQVGRRISQTEWKRNQQ